MLCTITAFIFQSFFKSDGKTAEISVEGKVIVRINLAETQNKTFCLSENEHIIYEIKDGRIRITESDCPDKICKNKGFISKSGESIVCMPNKTIVEIKD